jgi:hypothetical protein
MKPRTLISLFALALPLATGSTACMSESQPSSSSDPSAVESTQKTSEAQLITTAGSIMAWPMGPIAWNGLVGTWPIAVWSPAAIGGLAFDVAGVSNLAVTSSMATLQATTISTAFLNAFVPPVGVAGVAGMPLVGPGGLFAPAFGFTGAYAPFFGAGFGLGAFAPGAALTGTWLNGAFTPGWNAWFTPALTANALMFNNLAFVNTFTPFVFNVSFMAQSAAQATAFAANTAAFSSALSIFATPFTADMLAAQTAATTSAVAATTAAATTMPFMSMVFPIMMPIPALVPGAPALGAAAVPGTLL